MRINNKGVTTIGIIVAILIITFITIGLFMNPILNTSLNVKNSKDIIPNYIDNKTGIERVHGILNENISYNGSLAFEDIGVTYEFTETEKEVSGVSFVLDNQNNSFSIKSKSNVEIQLNAEGSGSYDIELILNGSKLIKEEQGLIGNAIINVDEDYIYNEVTGETNYGTYELNIKTHNVNVEPVVSYNKVSYRELEITGNNFEQTLIINNENDKTEVYFE